MPKTKLTSPKEQKASMPAAPKVVDMDFSRVRKEYADEDQSLLDFLKQQNLLQPHYGYSAFNPVVVRKLLLTGQYRFTEDGSPEGSVFCCRLLKTPCQSADYIGDPFFDISVLKYCETVTPDNKPGMIAVYDLTLMEEIGSLEFRFTPEALVGVVKLKGF